MTAENVAARRAETYSTPLVRVDAQGYLHTVILVHAIDDHVLALLGEYGVRFEIVKAPRHMIQAWIPFDRLVDVAALPVVQYLRPPSYAMRR